MPGLILDGREITVPTVPPQKLTSVTEGEMVIKKETYTMFEEEICLLETIQGRPWRMQEWDHWSRAFWEDLSRRWS